MQQWLLEKKKTEEHTPAVKKIITSKYKEPKNASIPKESWRLYPVKDNEIQGIVILFN